MKRATDDIPPGSKKRFKKMSQVEHVIAKPGMYVGSVAPLSQEVWTMRFAEGVPVLAHEKVDFAPALYKIFDEVVTNALDASVKDVSVKKITVTITESSVTVRNDGNGEAGIPIERSPENENVWIPAMIFGDLLTSSNYDEDAEDAVAGTNGLGVKLCNIHSEKFSVNIRNSQTGSTYTQEWRDSMSLAGEPKVKLSEKPSLGFVEVSFQPLARLLSPPGVISESVIAVLAKRTLDVALAARKGMTVTFNGSKLPVGSIKAYAKLFAPEASVVVDESDPNWRVAMAHAEEGSVHGLVNGVSSTGKHVTHVSGAVASALAPKVKAKRGGKDVVVRPASLLAHSILIVASQVVKPIWSSQVKRELESFDFISRYKPSEDFISKLAASAIAAAIVSSETSKSAAAAARKTDGKKVATLNIPKLRDATKAGTAKSDQCTLILTEGDSALTFAVAALPDLGFDKFGAFPLKGVLLNTRDASAEQTAKNDEITAIKQILGLKTGIDSPKGLRYGRIWILSDQDADGAHIRGLVINFLHHGWPKLVNSGFISVVPTPVIRARKGTSVRDFYSMKEYAAWEATGQRGWNASYFKGLGSWTSADAREILKRTPPTKFVGTEHTDGALVLAFNKKIHKGDEKKPSDMRKDWICKAVATPPDPLTYASDIPIERFVHSDLVNFSVYAVQRAIPQITDGLCRSQVKIMFSVLDGGFVDARRRIKVAQLGARVAEKTAYLHGEASLLGAITNMGQAFAGSNNVNLLHPDGQFGCLAPNTEVLLWDSTLKKAKDVVVGDKLVGDDGTVRNVLETTAGVDEMYKIDMFDGGSYTVNSQHYLTLKLKTPSDEGTFSETFDLKVDDYLKLSTTLRRSLFCVKNSVSIAWCSSGVSTEPYAFGCALGTAGGDHSQYLCNDEHTRLEVLAGCVDTAGVVRVDDSGVLRCEISQSAESVSFLQRVAASLGFRTHVSRTYPERMSVLTLYADGMDKLRTRLRSQKTARTVACKADLNTYAFEVTRAGEGAFHGWSVDGNERFLLGDFTVTHNSRLGNGSDKASARYIHTFASSEANALFRKEDAPIYKHLTEEGQQVEPETLLPVLPVLLLNGGEAIAVGFSTSIPAFKPSDVIANVRNFIGGREITPMVPWYRGFNGTVEKADDGRFKMSGVWTEEGDTVTITELPVGVAFNDYADDLKCDKSPFVLVDNRSTGDRPHFVVKYRNEAMRKEVEKPNRGIEKALKLVSHISYSNMFAFNSERVITKYDSPEAILGEFCSWRLERYKDRKEYMLGKMAEGIVVLENKARFVREVSSREIDLGAAIEKGLEERLLQGGYAPVQGSFDYLLGIQARSFTKDRAAALERELSSAISQRASLEEKAPAEMWLEEISSVEAVL